MTEATNELIPSFTSTKTLSAKGSDKIMLTLVFVMFITMLTIVVVLLAGLISRDIQSSATASTDNTNTLEAAGWIISKAEPTGTTLKITATSSIGNVRTYENVRSFGMSNDGTRLALSTATDLNLIDMPTNTSTKVELPYAYYGDMGEQISWANDDTFFTIAGFKELTDDEGHILIFTAEGKLAQDIRTQIALTFVDGQKVAAKAKFSPDRKLIVVRTYNLEDHQIEPDVAIANLPAALTVFNLEGQPHETVYIGETAGKQLIYTWGESSHKLRYLLTDGNNEINYASEQGFTLVGIE